MWDNRFHWEWAGNRGRSIAIKDARQGGNVAYCYDTAFAGLLCQFLNQKHKEGCGLPFNTDTPREQTPEGDSDDA